MVFTTIFLELSTSTDGRKPFWSPACLFFCANKLFPLSPSRRDGNETNMHAIQ